MPFPDSIVEWARQRRDRWRFKAFLARHGNQQIPLLLGRGMTRAEQRLLYEELAELLRAEPTVRLG